MDIKIIRMEPKPGAKIEKDPPGGRSPNVFHVDVICVLEDGRLLAHEIRSSRKRDVAEELAKLPRAVNNMAVDSRDGHVMTSYSLCKPKGH